MVNFDLNTKTFPASLLDGKRILYIPVVSMRSHDTGIYDLACDGNVNRMIAFFNLYNYEQLTITLPEAVENRSFIEDRLRCSFRHIDAYGKNANETRSSRLAWYNFFYDDIPWFNYDVIIFEPNIIGSFYIPPRIDAYFWSPVSRTTKGSPSFITEFDIQDVKTHLKYPMIVASNNQEAYWNMVPGCEVYQHNLNWIPEKEEFKTPTHLAKNPIFLPFRLTDTGYRIPEIMDALIELADEGEEFTVYYTSPNDAPFEYEVPNIKWPKDRDYYYKMLTEKPIIIYLEDPDEILHTSVLEFIEYDCRLIYLENELFRHKTTEGQIGDVYEDLKYLIRKMLNGKS